MMTVDVVVCGDCPFAKSIGDRSEWCFHLDAPALIPVQLESFPPDQCPLRKETTLVQLAGTFDYETFGQDEGKEE